ncbi:hypothetical protein [Sphingomonas lycopersici]|uniref:Uncharacterized protein n=1 Tax=Sphingomonas lycopersici TaxID=2951807 RepID=A0AA42CS98_9SPHN|nr:hypothetical protein [Sphingomonas lycopersici]MCW6537064.1 hypothetical protein [Sphingomonas lycopersici]
MPPASAAPRRTWWIGPGFVWVCILLSTVPLLWPAIPPLVDVPGHIGRYHVAIDLWRSADLQRHWDYHWAPIGNLGVDLLVIPLAKWVGVELATKLITVAIPPLFVAGLIRLSHAATGTLSPSAALAFPLAYGYPFQFGFVNFMLAAALALHALASWIRLADRPALRAMIFIPVSCLLWVAHSFGWGLFGLLAFTAEVMRLRSHGWLRAAARAALMCTPLALPLFPMLTGAAGPDHGVSYNWLMKIGWLASLLRERWQAYDAGCVTAIVFFFWVALRNRASFRFDPLLGALALVGFAAYLALPRLLLGGAYVDMRMLGIAVAIAILAVHPHPGASDKLAPRLALVATGFFLLRTATSTAAMLLYASTQQSALAAVAHIPRGAGVLVLVNEPCDKWHSDRLEHLDGIAIARRDAFVNGQWALPGQQLLRTRHPEAAPYLADPSQLVYPRPCEARTTDFAAAIRDFDRATFRYVWTMGFAARPRPARDVRLIWSNDRSALYRVEP